LLLHTVRKVFSRFHLLLIAAIVAAWFSLLHYAFYGWIVPAQFSGSLTAGTLFSLFAVGLLRNTLILRDGHIAYAWSLHLSSRSKITSYFV
jgi:polyferredoxin